ncbi:MAG: DUF2065 domain-containing protein [Janthinobacterium lividum]
MLGTFLLAIALMLIFEGMFPFVAPLIWRETFRRIVELSDRHIRLGGLIAIGAGLLIMWAISL